MKKILVILVSLVAFSFAANAASYEVDNASIDALFNEAELVLPAEAPAALPAVDGQTKTIVSMALIFTGLNFFGIHRVILGTDIINVLWYTITFGGIFGIVPVVDFIVELLDVLDGSGTAYLNNPKFIMWL